jgi:hypothetical protein
MKLHELFLQILKTQTSKYCLIILKNNNAYGIEVSGNLDFKKWWSANISVDAYQKKK